MAIPVQVAALPDRAAKAVRQLGQRIADEVRKKAAAEAKKAGKPVETKPVRQTSASPCQRRGHRHPSQHRSRMGNPTGQAGQAGAAVARKTSTWNWVRHLGWKQPTRKVLKSISLELRHLLEGSYDTAGHWHPGDLEQRLAALGVRRDREPVKVDEMPHLPPMDRKARQVVDAYLELRAEAGVESGRGRG